MASPIIGKCFICRTPLRPSQDARSMLLQSRLRKVHGWCADQTSDLEAVTERVRKEFPGSDVVGSGRTLGFGLLGYLQNGRTVSGMGEAGYDPIRDGLAESWHDAEHPPKVGDVLIGSVLSVDIGRNGFGRYPIVTVVAEKGSSGVAANERVAFHGFTSVAMSQLNKARPRPGERIRIECTNVPEQKGVRGDYWGWSVRVDRKLAETDWDAAFGVPEDYIRGDETTPEKPEPAPEAISEEPPF